MTRNFHDTGFPAAAWVTAARSPSGQFGVAIGEGDTQVAFVEEGQIPAFLAAGRKIDDGDGLLALVAAAAAGLEKFKNDYRRRLAAAKAAPLN